MMAGPLNINTLDITCSIATLNIKLQYVLGASDRFFRETEISTAEERLSRADHAGLVQTSGFTNDAKIPH